MRRSPFHHNLLKVVFAVAALCVFAGASKASAQSSDVGFPAPVFSNEIAARIAPRDLGDSRQTRHFYTFNGTEGDLTVTIESSELNGDVDVFVAKTLRPLLKVTLFGGAATKATKSFYLRKEETLLLRVEARAIGDTEGSYRILLGGSFAPAAPGLAQSTEAAAPPPESSDTTRRSGTRRVTATGARIEEPRTETAEAAPTPTPEAKPTEDTASAEAKPAPTREARSRRGKNPRGATSRAGRPAPEKSPAETKGKAETANNETSETPKPDAEKTESVTPPTPERTPNRAARRRGARAANRPAPVPKPSAAESSGATTPTEPPPVVTILRLVIITKDGQTLERDMSTVRRVTVENNQIVVSLKDGKVIRTPLAIVAKMSFEP